MYCVLVKEKQGFHIKEKNCYVMESEQVGVGIGLVVPSFVKSKSDM